MKKASWYEVWIEGSSDKDFFYLLLLRQVDETSLEIIDPHQRNNVIESFDKYDEAVHWLSEDEYELVEGRWSSSKLEESFVEFEVWYKEELNSPSVILLRLVQSNIVEVLILDGESQLIGSFDSYEDAKFFIERQNYKLVRGREMDQT